MQPIEASRYAVEIVADLLGRTGTGATRTSDGVAEVLRGLVGDRLRATEPGARAMQQLEQEPGSDQAKEAATVALATAASRPSLPEAAIGTWDCVWLEPFTVVVEDGSYDLQVHSTGETIRGTWRLDDGRLVLDADGVVVEGVPDTADESTVLQLIFADGGGGTFEARPDSDGQRVDLLFPGQPLVSCEKRD